MIWNLWNKIWFLRFYTSNWIVIDCFKLKSFYIDICGFSKVLIMKPEPEWLLDVTCQNPFMNNKLVAILRGPRSGFSTVIQGQSHGSRDAQPSWNSNYASYRYSDVNMIASHSFTQGICVPDMHYIHACVYVYVTHRRHWLYVYVLRSTFTLWLTWCLLHGVAHLT